MPQDERKPTGQGLVDESYAAIGRLVEVLRGRPEAKGITIDGPTSRDLDDAIFLEKRPEGGYIVSVTIADVASLVDPKLTPEIDKEAEERAFTRYFADSNKPMIPRPLSEDRLSLLEGMPRPTITVSIPLDSSFRPEEPNVALTYLRSRKRFSYDGVEQELDSPKSEFAPMLQESLLVAQNLLKRRRAQGALAIYDINTGIATNEEGNLIQLEGTKHRAQIIIQEFMILANQTVAKYLADRDIPALYRNHKTKSIAPEMRETMLQMIEEAVLNPNAAERVRQTVNLNLERARYAPTVEGHYGLNLPAYMHFTSPIRRYADLVNHRILHAVLQAGNGPVEHPYTGEQLRDIATHINREADAIKDERAIHFKEIAQRRANKRSLGVSASSLDSLEPAVQKTLESLSAKQYSDLIRRAVDTHELPSALQQEAKRRCENGTINQYDIFAILFLFPDQDLSELKNITMRWLQKNAHNGIGVLNMAQQILGWEKPQYTELHEGSANAGIHTVRVQLKIGDEELPTVQASRSQKEAARQAAVVNALAKVVGVELPDDIQPSPQIPEQPTRRGVANPEVANETPIIQRTAEPGINYKNPLLELSQKNKWTLPKFRLVSQNGTSQSPEFIVEVHITINGEKLNAFGIGRTVKDAEQDAASKLLPEVALLNTQVTKTEIKRTPVQQLNELRQQNAFQSVHDDFTKSGPDNEANFTFTYLVLTKDGRSIEVTGKGTRKIDAQQQAAQMVLDALSK